MSSTRWRHKSDDVAVTQARPQFLLWKAEHRNEYILFVMKYKIWENILESLTIYQYKNVANSGHCVTFPSMWKLQMTPQPCCGRGVGRNVKRFFWVIWAGYKFNVCIWNINKTKFQVLYVDINWNTQYIINLQGFFDVFSADNMFSINNKIQTKIEFCNAKRDLKTLATHFAISTWCFLTRNTCIKLANLWTFWLNWSSKL